MSKWGCLITAFSKASKIDEANLLHRLGHDGSAIAFPDYPEPYNRRSFHVQEIVDALFPDFYIMEIEPEPMLSSGSNIIPIYINNVAKERLMRYINAYPSVLIGHHAIRPDSRHAVAYLEGQIHDVYGRYNISEFKVWTAYICIKRRKD